MWTVAEDYSFVPAIQLFRDYEDEDTNFYKMAVLGYAYGKLDLPSIIKYLNIMTAKQNNREELVLIAELVIESAVTKHLLTDRPGLVEYRNKLIVRTVDKYRHESKNTLLEELEYGYYSLAMGDYPKVDRKTFRLLSAIKKAEGINESQGIIKLLGEIYGEFFYINRELKFYNEEIVKDSKEKSKKKPKKQKSIDSVGVELPEGDADDLDKYTIGAAEFTDLSDYEKIENIESEGRVATLSSGKKDSVKSIIEKHFGNSILGDNENAKIESQISVGAHQGIAFHLTKGNYGDDVESKYYEAQIALQHEENYEKYLEDELKYRRSVNQLREIIRKNVIQDLDTHEKITNNGKIIPSYIWKRQYLNEENIFLKTFKEEYGALSVDILLDSSASQLDRQADVAIQAYIIAEALVSLNIPTRVTGFNNLFNHLIVKEYRDYNDSLEKNMNIFDYLATGSNRDGMAIKYTTLQMQKQNAENKILIILSDGRPNDKIEIGVVGGYKFSGANYQDDVAIKDTAKEVLHSKLNGISVLGVFTGLEEDLEQEKLIYGQDFAYITNIQRFSTIIGVFLKNLLDVS